MENVTDVFMMVLPWVLVAFNVIFGIVCFDEDKMVLSLGCFVFAIVIAFATICSYFEPKEIIQVDGYTYEICDEPPEQFIERNGYTYKLQEVDKK